MPEQRLGIIMNGVTGRMGTNQHLARSVMAIREEGGVRLADGTRVIPDPILVGRNPEKLEKLAAEHGVERWTTDLDEALGNPDDAVFFDAASTKLRPAVLKRAIAARKHIYCEKPVATSLSQALGLCRAAKRAGVRHGVVQDMLCHWRYVLDSLFGEVKSVSCLGARHIAERWDENGSKYRATADDAAYATFRLAGGVIAHFNSSWCVRVRRDDLVTFQVDGTKGTAVAGLTRCFAQSLADTPRPVWNPDVRQTHDFGSDWKEVPDDKAYDNAFKAEWELFIRHVCEGAPFRWNLLEGAKGLQLVECALKSWRSRRWVDVPSLKL